MLESTSAALERDSSAARPRVAAADPLRREAAGRAGERAAAAADAGTFEILVAVASTFGGIVATLSGFGIGSVIAPLLAMRYGMKAAWRRWRFSDARWRC
jgi:hypothetical protein